MLTPLATRDDHFEQRKPQGYYYSPTSNYYHPIPPFGQETIHPTSSNYDDSEYYPPNPVAPQYPQTSFSNSFTDDNLNTSSNSSRFYQPPYPYSQHYSPEEPINDGFYAQKTSDPITAPLYEYGSPSAPRNYPTLSSYQTYNMESPPLEASPTSVPNNNSNNSYFSPFSNPSGGCRSGSIVVELINQDLWQKFAPHTLENIITKTGRRMFPTLEYKVYGLKPESTYNMYVDMVLVDVNHWKFNSGKWIPSGQAEQCQKTNHVYLHPDSPNSGVHWMKCEKISFAKLKLTNNKQLPTGHPQHQMTLILNSMHKYMPRLNIVEVSSRVSDSASSKTSSSLKHTFTFPETQFIAVTAYQNTDVTQLKIDNNPFAKGFRDVPENRNTQHYYSYGSPSPPYDHGSSVPLEYYGHRYEQERIYKKKKLI